MTSAWFETWFNKHYLSLYQHRDEKDALDQIDLILTTLDLKKSDPLLDLACGVGRHTQLLRKRGYWMQGMDLSRDLIREGLRLFPNLPLTMGDMRSFVGGYQAILSLFTSFGYFEKESEDKKVLSHVFQALRPGGYYWLDFLNDYWIRENLVAQETISVHQRESFEIKRFIKDGRVIKIIEHTFKDRVSTYRESVSLYSKDQLEALLRQAGFELKAIFGDYRGSLWSEQGTRAIFVGKKKIG